MEEVGHKQGRGFSVNVPWPHAGIANGALHQNPKALKLSLKSISSYKDAASQRQRALSHANIFKCAPRPIF